MKPLVVIPARGGSKGVPGKNWKELHGKPLINYTIDAARKAFGDDCICVSTDSEKIKQVAESTGLKVPFLRPDYLATDKAGTYEVLLHAIEYYENEGYMADTLILLQPTSPFRTSEHIEEALKLYDDTCEAVVSVKETKANPYYVLFEENEEGWLSKSKKSNAVRRQDVPLVYELNGAIYIINIKALKAKPISEMSKIRKYEMDEAHSHDIDTALDWVIAESIITAGIL